MAVDLPPSNELANVPPQLLEIMRVMRQDIEKTFAVDSRDASFARLGGLMCLGSTTPGSIGGHISPLRDMGVTDKQIWAVLCSIIGHIGMQRCVSMLPVLESEIGV